MSGVVLFVVPPEEAAQPAVTAMVAAASEGLPSGTRVVVSPRATDADVVVVVRWADAERRRATVEVRPREGATSQRVLAFSDADPEAERGRAVGFAVVAMVPERLREPEAPPPPAPAPTPPPGSVERPRPPPAREPRVWLEASAQGSAGLGGPAGAVGPALAARLPLGPLAPRLGVAGRFGDVGEADATMTTLRADAGLSYWTVLFGPTVRGGARVGLVAVRHAVRRTEPGGAATSDAHALLGAEALAEGAVAIAGPAWLVAGIGAEIAFGTTRVFVGPERVADVPPARLVGELGARFSF